MPFRIEEEVFITLRSNCLKNWHDDEKLKILNCHGLKENIKGFYGRMRNYYVNITFLFCIMQKLTKALSFSSVKLTVLGKYTFFDINSFMVIPGIVNVTKQRNFENGQR